MFRGARRHYRVVPDGQCSLIEAIVNANADASLFADCEAGNGPDTIVLPANADVRLSDIYDATYGPTGLPVITSLTTGCSRSKTAGFPET